MKQLSRPAIVAALLVSASLSALIGAGAARTAEEILKDYEAVKAPVIDREKAQARDQEYIKSYMAEVKEYNTKRGTLAKELFDVDPTNAKLPAMLESRWMSMPETASEADAIIAAGKPEFLVPTATAAKVIPTFRAAAQARTPEKFAESKKAVEEFISKYPKDAHAEQFANTLVQIAAPDQKDAVKAWVVEKFPGGQMASAAKAEARQKDGVGKPFELKFTEAITGKEISMESLKGKVVVIDFWATWCPPCRAEMPHNKEIYAQYKDKGVEFIGVSLDQPEETGKGLTKLKEYCAKEGITWPQYYQGNYWNSEFSKSWGINSIPAVFIVDKQGNLHSTEARGKLEEMIPELLAK